MKKLLATLSFLLLLAPAVASADLSTGLVGYWPMDTRDFFSATTIVDRSGNSNTGTLVNGPTKVVGKIGQALNFNGTSQYVALPSNQPFNNDTGNSTETAWFKTTGTGVIVSDNNTPPGGTPNGYDPLLYIETNGVLHAGGYINSFPNLVSSSALNNGTWHFAALTHNGSTQSLYVDGTFVSSVSGTVSGVTGTNYWVIGTGYTGNGWPNSNGLWFYFKGAIDDVRIYNRALSASEVQAIYRQAVGNHQGSWESTIISFFEGLL
jgi:hypothetical protein